MQSRLFLPTARQTNWLLLLALLSLGEALYLRYLAIEYAQVSLACQAGLNTWLCATFRLVIVLFNYYAFGWIALAVLSVQAALGLVFDARYRDFPFAPLTAATIPLLLARKGKPAIKGKVLATWKRRLQAPAAETAMAVTLAASAVYIVCNESFANWQAVWFSGALLALAFTLLQAQDGPS